jgi:glutathione peroxidase
MENAIVSGLAAMVVLASATSHAAAGEKGKNVAPVLQFQMQSIDGKTVDLAKYQGKVVLIVNVASECGYTPQYKGLQELHAKHAKDGLAVLGIPSNDYGGQEPGSNSEIARFCAKNYGVTFDMFAKVGVAEGKDQSPLYKFLTSKKTDPKHAGPVRWNFEKFLIGRDGSIVARFEADVDPESDAFRQAIQTELEKK